MESAAEVDPSVVLNEPVGDTQEQINKEELERELLAVCYALQINFFSDRRRYSNTERGSQRQNKAFS